VTFDNLGSIVATIKGTPSDSAAAPKILIAPIQYLQVASLEYKLKGGMLDSNVENTTYSQRFEKFAMVIKDKKSHKHQLLMVQEVIEESQSKTKARLLFESTSNLKLIHQKLQNFGKHSNK